MERETATGDGGNVQCAGARDRGKTEAVQNKECEEMQIRERNIKATSGVCWWGGAQLLRLALSSAFFW